MRSYKLPQWSGLCITCGRGEDQVNFGGGKAGECNTCTKKKWNVENPIKLRAHRLYGNAQKRAKSQGWPAPDFTSLWIEDKILAGVCEVTGLPFDLIGHTTTNSHAKNPWVPSIDRIDSAKPYLKDNVQIVVYMYNVCKSEFAHVDVIKFCRAIASLEVQNV